MEKQFQRIRKSQGIGFFGTSFLSFPIPVLPDSSRIKEKETSKKILEVGGAPAYLRNTAGGYWGSRLAYSAGLDQLNGSFQSSVRESKRHPKLQRVCTGEEGEGRLMKWFFPDSCYVPLAS